MGNDYILLWQEIIPDSEFSKRFRVENQVGFLPFYVSDHDYFLLKDNKEIKLNEFMLLRGLLFAYNDADPKANYNRELYYDQLLRLFWGFHKNSLADTILEISTMMREEYALFPSYKTLKTGITIIPTNTDIRMDFILSIWDLINENPDTTEIKIYLTEINEAFKILDIKYVTDFNNYELVVYICFVALYFLQMENEKDAFIVQYVNTYVTNTFLLEKVKMLLVSNPHEVIIKSSFIVVQPNYPATLVEAVTRLYETLSKEQIEAIKEMTLENFHLNFFNLGMFIRNSFGLWENNKALIDDCKTQHPDDASVVIMKALWEFLQNN